MKILVTGGLGYIGSHTAVALQQAGFEVLIIDNMSNSSIEVLEGISEITGVLPEFKFLDLREKNDVSHFLKPIPTLWELFILLLLKQWVKV